MAKGNAVDTRIPGFSEPVSQSFQNSLQQIFDSRLQSEEWINHLDLCGLY